MKHLRKVMALVLAAFMALVVVAPAWAAEGTLDSSISVTALNDNDKVNYYQILEFSSDPAVAPKGWKLVDALATPAPGLTLSGKTGAEAVDEILDGITQDEADTIAAYIRDNQIAATGSNMSVSSGKWEVTNPDAGLYMVVVAASESGVVYSPAFVGADYVSNVDPAPKNDTNTIALTTDTQYSGTSIAKKTITEVFKTTEDANSAVAQAIDSKYGEIATFYVNTTLPVYLSSFTDPTFTIVDTIKTAGLELVVDETHPVTVEYGGDSTNASNNDLTLTAVNGATSLTVDFDSGYLSSNITAQAVKITYYAKVIDPTKANLVVNENDVEISYTNGPTTEKGAMKDVTNHYTFNIGGFIDETGGEGEKHNEIRKVGLDDNGEIEVEITEGEETVTKYANPLANAKFGLYTDEGCNTLFTNDYYPADTTVKGLKADTDDTGATCRTEDDGILTFLGLDQGTYYVKEIEAPTGYVKNNHVYEVVIDATYEEQNVTETDPNSGITVNYKTEVLTEYTITVDGKNVSTFTATYDNGVKMTEDYTVVPTDIINDKGSELPSTGGMGTRILYTIGGIMLVGGAVALVSKKRVANMEK